jgi:hypothetical protein
MCSNYCIIDVFDETVLASFLRLRYVKIRNVVYAIDIEPIRDTISYLTSEQTSRVKQTISVVVLICVFQQTYYAWYTGPNVRVCALRTSDISILNKNYRFSGACVRFFFILVQPCALSFLFLRIFFFFFVQPEFDTT